MGNTTTHNINNIAKIEKNNFGDDLYKIYMKDGTILQYVYIANKISLLRLENYLRVPYSQKVTESEKTKISEANKEKISIRLLEHTFYFPETQETQRQYTQGQGQYTQGQKKQYRTPAREHFAKLYLSDMMSYNKLVVHRVHFEALFNKVLENNDEIYSDEFRSKWNTEKDKFLNILNGKIENFHKSKL